MLNSAESTVVILAFLRLRYQRESDCPLQMLRWHEWHSLNAGSSGVSGYNALAEWLPRFS